MSIAKENFLLRKVKKSEEKIKTKPDPNNQDNLKKDSKIRHPFFWVIVLITIIFGGTLVVWFIALIWAHWPGNVIVPEVILKNLQSEQNFDDQQNVEPDHIQSSDESEKSNFSTETNDSIESKIAKINELLNKGLITQEEFDSKKRSILDSI